MPEFPDAQGVAIVYDVYPAETRPRAVVQIAHGVGEHAARYRWIAEALAARGYTVYADDHRGHGRTGIAQHGGDASQLGRLGKGGHPAALAAVWDFTRLIRDENPDLPLILLGHSWGSFLSQKLVNEHPDAYDAVVLTGSALVWPGSVNTGQLNTRWQAPGAMGTEWLSSDLTVGRAFLDDPLTTTVPIGKLFGTREGLRVFGRPRRHLGRDLPVLLMVGRDDPVGGPRSVHRLADAYRLRSGLTDVTTLVYPDARHELFNELAKDDVRDDLLAWLDARFAARD